MRSMETAVNFNPLYPESQTYSVTGDSLEKNPGMSRTQDPKEAGYTLPAAHSNASKKVHGSRCLWRIGVTALVAGVTLVLFATLAAFLLLRNNGKQVISVHYNMNINGKLEGASLDIDPVNSLERFRSGSGDKETVEVHDFQVGITAVWFSGGDKCYIKPQAKANLHELGMIHKEPMIFELGEEIVPLKSDGSSPVWVVSEEPIKDKNFLSSQILNLCGGLPIYWLHWTQPKGQRKRRDVQRERRQYEVEEFEDGVSNVPNATTSTTPETQEILGSGSAGSAYNPDNPYHRKHDSGTENMILDSMLDLRGICCSECQRSYTHCERICEPLAGYWPYNYQGCRVACRVIMPCRWWLARILGLV